MDFMNMMRANVLTKTENGAIGYESTGHALVDLNFSVPMLRSTFSEFRKQIKKYNNDQIDYGMLKSMCIQFDLAYHEDKIRTIKWLLYLRDIKHGLGEREAFRGLLAHLSDIDPDTTMNILLSMLIQDIGRWDDIIDLYFTTANSKVKTLCKLTINSQLKMDIKNMKENKPISLLAKWIPSMNASSVYTRRRARELKKALPSFCKYTDKQYRKLLSQLRKYLDVLEVKMSDNQWYNINYEHVPSKANLIYNGAFLRHDENRRRQYLEDLKQGKAKINANSLFLYDIVRKYWNGGFAEMDDTLEELWKHQTPPGSLLENTLVIRDGSGSMRCTINDSLTAQDVADSIALYCAEHIKSKEFKNKFISFSMRPYIVDLNMYHTLYDKLIALAHYDDCSNTDIESVFNLVLNTAINNKLSQEDLPKNLIIISDMEFDMAMDGSTDQALFDMLSERFKEHGYTIPRLIFWNVNSRTGTIPMTHNSNGLVLVSGFSKTIVEMILTEELDPYKALIKILDPMYPQIDLMFAEQNK